MKVEDIILQELRDHKKLSEERAVSLHTKIDKMNGRVTVLETRSEKNMTNKTIYIAMVSVIIASIKPVIEFFRS